MTHKQAKVTMSVQDINTNIETTNWRYIQLCNDAGPKLKADYWWGLMKKT